MSYFHIFAFVFSFFQQKKVIMAELLLLIKTLKIPTLQFSSTFAPKSTKLNPLD